MTGLYFYDRQVIEMARKLKPSALGELEITDIKQLYLDKGKLSVTKLGRGHAWLDTGAHDRLVEAIEFIRAIKGRRGQKVGCPEEAAFSQGRISADNSPRRARSTSF
ncbi:sugar phosphate nucleotidyltransferase [Caulobacter sp. BE254]|uniref:sugar phosphate nucleotidyltransferase n=1 Tax=Caulobacter sp. BE254 TaxID=2817720 RepID=UPI0028595882|nr:dTDP-glucose pyrophosphorylase [Caulobacter sp. BE254]